MSAMSGPRAFTFSWIAICACWAVLVTWLHPDRPWEWKTYAQIRNALSVLFTVSAFLCLWRFALKDIFENQSTAKVKNWIVAAMVFWALFPPIFFFLEYLWA